jgi:hypothetical protein
VFGAFHAAFSPDGTRQATGRITPNSPRSSRQATVQRALRGIMWVIFDHLHCLASAHRLHGKAQLDLLVKYSIPSGPVLSGNAATIGPPGNSHAAHRLSQTVILGGGRRALLSHDGGAQRRSPGYEPAGSHLMTTGTGVRSAATCASATGGPTTLCDRRWARAQPDRVQRAPAMPHVIANQARGRPSMSGRALGRRDVSHRGRIVSSQPRGRCIKIQPGRLSRRAVAGDCYAVNDVLGS